MNLSLFALHLCKKGFRSPIQIASCTSLLDFDYTHTKKLGIVPWMTTSSPAINCQHLSRCLNTTNIKICDKLVLKGIVAAPCTPLTEDGEMNLDGFESYADHMISTGITGLFVNGTLGEGMSLTVEERKQTVEKWMQLSKERFDTVIVHCGAGSIKDTKELCAHAEKAEAHAVAVMCPTLFKPDSISTLVTYLSEVARSCPLTPFLYYDINILTGVVFDTAEVIRQCKVAIPNFSGIKYSCRELNYFEMGLAECESGRYKIALGTVDEEFLPWLPLGAEVPICHSFMGSIHAQTRDAFLSGSMEKARESQKKAQKIGIIKRKYGADIPVSKAILKMMGADVGPVRLPLLRLSQEKYSDLEKDLKHAGLLL